MRWKKPPVSVLAPACLYLVVGVAGFAYHFHELLTRQPDAGWVELTEFLAVVCGVFMLRGQNWARWLAIAWMAFHVAISFPVPWALAVHSLFLAAIAWLLFRPEAMRYFGGLGALP